MTKAKHIKRYDTSDAQRYNLIGYGLLEESLKYYPLDKHDPLRQLFELYLLSLCFELRDAGNARGRKLDSDYGWWTALNLETLKIDLMLGDNVIQEDVHSFDGLLSERNKFMIVSVLSIYGAVPSSERREATKLINYELKELTQDIKYKKRKRCEYCNK